MKPMPLYDFQCLACAHIFEREHPRGVENPICPLCKGGTEKLLSPPPIIFKGGGFYKTDASSASRKLSPETPISESVPTKKENEKGDTKGKTTDSKETGKG